MVAGVVCRAWYRVKQFGWAVASWWRKPTFEELAAARAILPPACWRVFERMPAVDQIHALKVLEAVQAAGFDDRALAQAALLHDVAKRLGGVTLFHRVAVVIIKAFAREPWERLKTASPPSRSNRLLYPLWAHANHPLTGAQLAAECGCCAGAVDLIRRHQDPLPPAAQRTEQDKLLAALQRADDDN
jgi:hypothetical protein